MVCEKLTPLSSQILMRLSSSMEVVPFRKLQKKVKLIIILIIPRTRLHYVLILNVNFYKSFVQ